MAKASPALLCLLILALTALACAPAAPPATPEPTPTATPLPTPTAIPTPTPQPTAATPDEISTCSRFPDKARLFREHNAVAWKECPVIEKGVLRASGTVKGSRALLNNPSVATFVIKHRNSDRDALVILRPPPPGSSYPHKPGTTVATHWELDSKSFSLKAPVDNLDSPVDLLVWGSDLPAAYISIPPLAIRSIGYIR